MKKKNELRVNTENELVDVENIYQDIRNKIMDAREKMFKHIDTTMTEVYWYVGKITYELSENTTKANYGKRIIDALSSKLTNEFGSGFSSVSIRRMRRFYEMYPIWSAVPTELSWSHFQELIRVDRKEEREFYELEAIKSNWGYRELGRQINTKLYDRYLISPNKKMILDESKKGLIERQPEEFLKSPYIFEFAGLKENKNYLETDLESALLSHLTEFLLELGRGFSYVASQQRIKIGAEYYYPDLIFYNRLARCFVIIDLKIGKLTHQDIGQMQMYVNYYKKTQMINGENEPIGILLCADKDDAVVEMTLGDNVKNVYASKYLTYLPTKEELIKIIKDEKALYELANEDDNYDGV
ncbi:MAG: PDDEXK nuclease domain-containing protein [Bacilli bacterium]|nr:PDDEXK nuclease domain-containing protein [Bacilli bacterium]